MTAIATALERLERMIDARPGFGNGTARSVTTLTEGTCCSSEEAQWVTTTDLPTALGGAATAPSPGVLVRAALGSCMAMTYRLRAARHGVDLTTVRVTVETDSELVGMLVCDAGPRPGFTGLRFHVEVETGSSRAEVERVIDEGDRLSPVLDALTGATTVQRTLSIRRSES